MKLSIDSRRKGNADPQSSVHDVNIYQCADGFAPLEGNKCGLLKSFHFHFHFLTFPSYSKAGFMCSRRVNGNGRD